MSNSVNPNEWKHSDIAAWNRERALREFTIPSETPLHWEWFKNCLHQIPFVYGYTMYDLGCGSGSTVRLLELCGYDTLNYVGLDFSEAMIENAKYWKRGTFFVEDFLMSERDYSNGILYCNGVIGLLPNPKEVLRKVMSFGAPYVILNRETVRECESTEYVEQSFPNGPRYYQYTFANQEFHAILQECGYTCVHSEGKCYLLKKL